MTATRARLPNRRPIVTRTFELLNRPVDVSVGFYDDGRPAEVFARTRPEGSDMNALTDDVGVVLSLLLQHGIRPAAIAKSLGRDSLIGAIVHWLEGLADG